MDSLCPFDAFAQAPPLALYLHIPFCERKCPYCDFNTYAGLDNLHERFVQALTKDIRRWGDALGHPPLQSVFIGGGTPTVLAVKQLASIMEAVKEAFSLSTHVEVTCEANPGTTDTSKFRSLKELGVNRLSLGAQSLHDDELRFLGRIHTSEQVTSAVRQARQAGFDNLNLDLIYGLPGQRLDQWRDTLEQVLALEPTHISCYALTIEEGTPFARWVRVGKIPPVDEDMQGVMYEMTQDILEEAGYVHYEISNWARPGRQCAHNVVYWRNQAYLGLGPGAHSHDGWHRWWMAPSPQVYIERIEVGEHTVQGWERIDRSLSMAETMILGLRLLQEGLERSAFRSRFGVDPVDVYQAQIERLLKFGLISVSTSRVTLTRRAYPIANQVFVEFLDV